MRDRLADRQSDKRDRQKELQTDWHPNPKFLNACDATSRSRRATSLMRGDIPIFMSAIVFVPVLCKLTPL